MNTPGQQIAAGGDDKTISVLLEELPQLAQNVHQLGGDCGSLPLPMGGIAAQLMLFLGTNEHGRQASVMPTSAAAPSSPPPRPSPAPGPSAWPSACSS